jgi:hypothetical protein
MLMLKRLSLLTVVSLAIMLAGGAVAGEKAETVTLEGKLVCAMCTLHAEDAKSCQSVLEVAASEEGAKPAFYYLAKNEATKELGMTCKGDQSAKITGAVMEKDGKKWITATKIEAI